MNAHQPSASAPTLSISHVLTFPPSHLLTFPLPPARPKKKETKRTRKTRLTTSKTRFNLKNEPNTNPLQPERTHWKRPGEGQHSRRKARGEKALGTVCPGGRGRYFWMSSWSRRLLSGGFWRDFPWQSAGDLNRLSVLPGLGVCETRQHAADATRRRMPPAPAKARAASR